MGIKLQLPKVTELRPRLTVIGVGGAGGNAVNNMIAAGLSGVDFVVANTDAQALLTSSAEHRIQLGAQLTEGLGAGSKPEVGEAAAEEAIDEIRARVTGAHMVFVAAGMGGGTGTGAAAVIARVAREEGVLVVGIVTKPFQFEGARRMRMAEAGIAELKQHVDTLIVIPNQNLFRIANEKTTFAEAFVLADQVLYSGISCIVDLIVKEGLINLDFADVRTILSGMGSAMMGTGEASGERRATLAAEEAITNPLLDDISLRGAKGLLLSIIGGRNLTLYEVDEAASRIRQEVDGEANIIVGATFDESLGDRVRVSIVASGMRQVEAVAAPPHALAPPLQSTRTHVPTQPFTVPGPMPRPQPIAPPGGASPAPAGARHAAPVAHADASAGPAQHLAAARDHAPRQGERSAADELTHRLTAAMADQGDDDPAYAHDTEPDAGATIAGAPWRAPGEVTIEEGPPLLMPAPPMVRERGGSAPEPHAAMRAGAAFAPAPPSEVRRAAQRRMPDLEDFPLVGQRDYRAKAGHEDHQRPAPPHLAPAPPPGAAEARKPSLLERLMGRRQAEPTPAPAESRERIAAPPQASPPSRAATSAPIRQTSSQRPPSATDRAAQKRVSSVPQAPQLPVFFSKDGR